LILLGSMLYISLRTAKVMTSINLSLIPKPFQKRGAEKLSSTKAFSLVEVVLAIAICAFVLIAILGLFTTGLQSSRESEQEIQAANLASTIISLRIASPTNSIAALPNFAIPTTAMTNAYGPAYTGSVYVGSDGQTNTVANAVYSISCQAGTNSLTGNGVAQVSLMLSWPPQASSASAAGHYEIVTYIPIR
jgi:type II secretory pathway pseudopilin PulG